MSGKLVTVGNRLITAVMLVVLLIACQDMPEAHNFDNIQRETTNNN